MSKDSFEDITVNSELDETVVVAFTQRPRISGPEIDLTGTADYDTAIAIAAKGLFSMILDSMGFFDDDDEDEEDGDFDSA